MMHLIIVDPNLKDFVGHHLEYDYSIHQAATKQGHKVSILANQKLGLEVKNKINAIPVFRQSIWEGFEKFKSFPGLFKSLAANSIFFFDLLRGLRKVGSRQPTLLFFHMLTRHQMLGCALYSLFFQPKQTKVIYLLRYQRDFYDGKQGTIIFWLLERAQKWKSLRFLTDSDRLAGELARLSSIPIEVAPIPHSIQLHHSINHSEKKSGIIRLVSLGNARDEKGIFEIFSAIEELANDASFSDYNSKIEFVLQVNDAAPDVQKQIEAFQKKSFSHVKLLTKALSSEEYQRLLDSADIVLLPYWRKVYFARTSGVFLEAVSAGKPVVATEDTWMSDELAQYGAGILCLTEDSQSLAASIRTAIRTLPDLAQKAQTDRQKVLAVHNPDVFLKKLLQPTLIEKKNKVLVLYPWNDFKEKNSGASVRVNLFVHFLESLFDEVHVIQGGHTPSYRVRNVYVQSYASSSKIFHWMKKFVTLVSILLFGKKSRSDVHWIWLHLRDIFDRNFKILVTHCAREAKIVCMEYTLSSWAVAPILKRLGIPLVLTQHDVLADAIHSSSILRNVCLKLEVSGLKKASFPVTLSNADQKVFQREGVETQVIPNPIDLRLIRKTDVDPSSFYLRLEAQLRLPIGRKVCLFVGSGHPPNVTAAKHIKRFAEAFVKDDSQSPYFLIVGACAKKEDFKNGMSAGRVSHELLDSIYRIVDLVVIPLEEGTGTSVKTIEAMAYGKSVLGSKFAFRGLQCVNQVQCILSDDFDSYPTIITKLLASLEVRKKLGENAQKFANRFHFENVFQDYLPYFRSHGELPAPYGKPMSYIENRRSQET